SSTVKSQSSSMPLQVSAGNTQDCESQSCEPVVVVVEGNGQWYVQPVLFWPPMLAIGSRYVLVDVLMQWSTMHTPSPVSESGAQVATAPGRLQTLPQTPQLFGSLV